MSREYLKLRVPLRDRLFKLFRWLFLITLMLVLAGTGLWFLYNDEQLISKANAETVKMAELTNDKTVQLAPSHSYIKAKNVEYGTASEIPSLEKLYKTRKETNSQKIIRRGTVSIPELGVKSAIYEGTNEESLVWGAGTAKPNQEMGKANYAISAHNYKQVANADEWFFSNIQTNLIAADESKEVTYEELTEKYVAANKSTKIYTTDRESVYTYEVLYREIVDKKSKYVLSDKRVKVFSNDKTPIITLTTCLEQQGIKDPNERIVVVGKLIETKKWSQELQDLYF